MARRKQGPPTGAPEAEPSAPKGPKNTPPPSPKGVFGHGAARVKTVYTREETAQHMALVEYLMQLPGTSTRQHVAECKKQFGFGMARYRNLKKRVHAEWELASEADRPANKTRQVRRIERSLAHAIGSSHVGPDGKLVWDRAPNHAATAKYEQLLANILGNNAPVEVNVHHTVSAALTDVLANLTPEQLDSCLQEYAETKRLADEFRRLPGAAE